MRIIKNWQDVLMLRKEKALPEELISCLEKCLVQLESSFEGGVPTGTGGIYPFCLIVLIEAGDNSALNMEPILTGTPAKGLMDAKFETVELLELDCGRFYHVSLLDDGRQMHMFTPVGVHGFHIESNLERLAKHAKHPEKEE